MTDQEREDPVTVHGNGAAVDTAEEPEANTTDDVEVLRARAADFEDRWKRSAAEFQNYRRRTDGERADMLRSANGNLIKELLPVLDDLERALANVPSGEAESKWVEGTRLVERKFRAIMERQGLTPIDALGQPFDPALHEAIGGSGTHVAQEFQRGYRLNGRTLRPSMVIVGDAPAETPAEADDLQA
jgi:molecular chaperone GrpE